MLFCNIGGLGGIFVGMDVLMKTWCNDKRLFRWSFRRIKACENMLMMMDARTRARMNLALGSECAWTGPGTSWHVLSEIYSPGLFFFLLQTFIPTKVKKSIKTFHWFKSEPRRKKKSVYSLWVSVYCVVSLF